jgi:hypothetical protein
LLVIGYAQIQSQSITKFRQFLPVARGVNSFSSCLKVIAVKHRLAVMAAMFQEIKQSLRRLYLDDARPWLVGFSGGIICTVVVGRDKASEGLLAAGDERMEHLTEFYKHPISNW